MGSSAWSGDDYKHIKKDYATKKTADIFTGTTVDNLMSPFGLKVRESRDSDIHPESLAIIVVVDVTGSMGRIPDAIIRGSLGTLMETLIAHGVEHAHIMFVAIGDHISDTTPLQVGQFEAGTKELNQWLKKIFLEGRGGGQSKESYSLAWLVASRHTSIDCFEKRGQKGFLFTIGDEGNWEDLSADSMKKLMGYAEGQSFTDVDLLAATKEMYHVFHIHANEGNYKDDTSVLGYWNKMLPERVIVMDDHTQVAEIIATTVAVMHGADMAHVTKDFDAATAAGVTKALATVDTSVVRQGTTEGVMRL